MPSVDYQIKAPEVDVVDQNGNRHTFVKLSHALAMARETGLNLVEVSPKSNPPVCKIMDFGKYKYEEQKKHSNSSTPNKKTKEVKMGVSISEHDLMVKLNKSIEFLKDGHAVKFIVQMKGREVTHKEVAINLMGKIIAFVNEHESLAKMQDSYKMMGNQIFAIFNPEKPK